MQGALTQEYLGSFEEAQHSRRRSGPQNYVANFEDRTLDHRSSSQQARQTSRSWGAVVTSTSSLEIETLISLRTPNWSR